MTDDDCRRIYNEAMELPNRNSVSVMRYIIAAYTAKLLAGVEMPEPALHLHGKRGSSISDQSLAMYTADKLQQYAAAAAVKARMKALEDAKGVCLNWSERHAIHDGCTYEDCDFVAAATDCANAIDKLKVTP